MVRKIKYIAALIMVMSLIYIQQSPVTYADSGKYGAFRQVREGGNREEGRDDLPEKGEEVPPEGGEGKPEEGEKPPEEGEEKPGEGEEKPPEGGEEKPGEEEKPPEGGEEKPPEGEEEKPPAEEVKPIKEYELEIPKANGKQGYYTEKPEIKISHISEVGVTKYCLKRGDKILEEKILKEKGDKAVIAKKTFAEGKNILHVWMEDEKGNKLEQYEVTKELSVDTKAPEIQINAPKGFDEWYQGQVVLSVSGEDSGSGVVKLSCREGTRDLGSFDKNQGEFVISQPSFAGKGVDITVTAEDKAGNKSERVKTVFIDKTAPVVAIKGAKDYMITGKTVNLTYEISEENILQEFYVQTSWENTKGRKRQLSADGWEDNGTGKLLTQTLKNDGIYHVKVLAKDLSGHVSVKEQQIIVDKTNPVIRYVEALEGQQLKEFRWDYPPRQMIRDFTTYAYEMRVDGQLYHMGETIRSEGKHIMTVKATDAAGNEAKVSAEFVVDHTAPEIVFSDVEEGEKYEEERTFKVRLAKEEDAIQKIQINGDIQKIIPGEHVYEYTLHTCKDYEVTVNASDRAGNESVKSIFFEIIPKKTLIEKITEPMKLQWSPGKKAKLQFPKTGKQDKALKKGMSGPLRVLCFSVFGGIITAAGVLYYKH